MGSPWIRPRVFPLPQKVTNTRISEECDNVIRIEHFCSEPVHLRSGGRFNGVINAACGDIRLRVLLFMGQKIVSQFGKSGVGETQSLCYCAAPRGESQHD